MKISLTHACKQGATRKINNTFSRTSYGINILLQMIDCISVHLLFFPKAMTFKKCNGRSSDLFYFLRPSHSDVLEQWQGEFQKADFRTYSYGYSFGFSPNSLFILPLLEEQKPNARQMYINFHDRNHENDSYCNDLQKIFYYNWNDSLRWLNKDCMLLHRVTSPFR
jgi:hypothetical protein